MLRFVLRRLGAAVLLLFLVLTLIFGMLHLVPGDPFAGTPDEPLRREAKIRLIHTYGLDRPLPEQYARWLGAVVLHGDWGTSFAEQRPALAMVTEALPATLLLAGAALLIEYGLGLALGVAAARRAGSLLDRSIRIGSLVLLSQPVFWICLMAILVFSYWLRWLPASHLHSVGADDMGAGARWLDVARHLVLPALTLGVPAAGAAARFVRASMLDVMGRDFIRTARAKGLSERRVLWVHGVRATLVPVVQLLGMSAPGLLSGALITEIVYSWPGIGRITYNAILGRDYPVVLATTAFSAIVVVVCTLAADLLHAVVDPRVRDA